MARKASISGLPTVFLTLWAGIAIGKDITVCPSEMNVPKAVATELDVVLTAISDPDAPLAAIFGYAPGGILSLQSPDWHYARAIGVADLKTGTPISCDMQFQIGSNTKMMTATILLQLKEEGALSLDDPLSRYLPDVAKSLPYGEEMTLTQLATHTSGIFSYTDNAPDGAPGIMEGGLVDPGMRQKGYEPRELVNFAVKHGEPSFRPGNGWAYSNTGYILLGMVIENIEGRPLTEVFSKRIFEPLRMSDTFYGTGILGSNFGLPKSYLKPPFDLDVSDWNLSQAGAAGAVVSTAADMHVFIEALLAGELFTSSETLALMKSTVPTKNPVLQGYGIGLASKGSTTWGHGGETLGFESDVALFADRSISMVGWGTSSHNVMAIGASAVTGALVGAGVLQDPAIEASDELRGQMIGPQWNLIKVELADGNETEFDLSDHYSIRFAEGGAFAALADCNRVLGNWSLDHLNLAITPGPVTLSACPPESKSEAYIGWLSSAKNAYLAEDELTIISQHGDDSVFLKFRPGE